MNSPPEVRQPSRRCRPPSSSSTMLSINRLFIAVTLLLCAFANEQAIYEIFSTSTHQGSDNGVSIGIVNHFVQSNLIVEPPHAGLPAIVVLAFAAITRNPPNVSFFNCPASGPTQSFDDEKMILRFYGRQTNLIANATHSCSSKEMYFAFYPWSALRVSYNATALNPPADASNPVTITMRGAVIVDGSIAVDFASESVLSTETGTFDELPSPPQPNPFAANAFELFHKSHVRILIEDCQFYTNHTTIRQGAAGDTSIIPSFRSTGVNFKGVLPLNTVITIQRNRFASSSNPQRNVIRNALWGMVFLRDLTLMSRIDLSIVKFPITIEKDFSAAWPPTVLSLSREAVLQLAGSSSYVNISHNSFNVSLSGPNYTPILASVLFYNVNMSYANMYVQGNRANFTMRDTYYDGTDNPRGADNGRNG